MLIAILPPLISNLVTKNNAILSNQGILIIEQYSIVKLPSVKVRAAGAMSTPSVMVPVGVLKRQGASVTTSIPGKKLYLLQCKCI